MRADKQTAVEWLVKELQIFATEQEMNIIQQALEMERQQLIEFYEDGLYAANYPHSLTGEAYFQKEYGNKD